jgi:outer membrane protein TolC
LDHADTIEGTGPLSVSQLVDLALANTPDLKAARLKRAVAAGQTKQAGILPNPSLTGAFLPLLSGAGTVPAWNVGLSQDI